jgi:hypothetical protein
VFFRAADIARKYYLFSNQRPIRTP